MESLISATDPSLLEHVRRRLAPLPGLVKLVVFGSRARRDARPDSDLDLMVVLDRPGSLGDRTWDVRQLLLDVHVPIDLVIYTPQEFDKLRHWKSSIAAIADREGLVLVG